VVREKRLPSGDSHELLLNAQEVRDPIRKVRELVLVPPQGPSRAGCEKRLASVVVILTASVAALRRGGDIGGAAARTGHGLLLVPGQVRQVRYRIDAPLMNRQARSDVDRLQRS
jgi:hypothetical protein